MAQKNVTGLFRYEKYVGQDGFELPYRLYLPADYDCGVMYPLLLLLHGAGERGSDNEEQISCNFNPIWEDPKSPARRSIILAPQCALDRQWVNVPFDQGNYSIDKVPESRELEAVMEIIKSIDREYNVDRGRIYISGISMGGYGTWDMIMRHPSVFAAAMPVCGAGDPSEAKQLALIPIRTFHGALDTCVPPEGTREMYRAIKVLGGAKIKYVEYPEAGHDVWTPVYENLDNIRWLFSKRRETKVRGSSDKAKKAGIAGVVLGVIGAVIFSVAKKKRRKKKAEKEENK